MDTFRHLSDTDLVITYQNTNNALAFGELYNRYNEKVFLYTTKILKNREQAMDLTQDLFIKISKKIKLLKEPVTFVKWLFRIAHNDCINLCKKNRKTRLRSITPNDNLIADSDELEAKQIFQNQLDKLPSILDKLSEEDQNLLIAKYFDNQSVADLMIEYKLSASAIKMRLNRSRKKAKALLQAV